MTKYLIPVNEISFFLIHLNNSVEMKTKCFTKHFEWNNYVFFFKLKLDFRYDI